MISKKNISYYDDYEINIDIETNLSNEKVNELFSILKNHSIHYNSIHELITINKKKLTKLILSLILLTILMYFIFQRDDSFSMLYLIIALPYFFTLSLAILRIIDIKTLINKIKNKKISLNFPYFSYWDQFKNLNQFQMLAINNVNSNMGQLFKNNFYGIVIYPNFAFEYASMNPKIYAGIDFSNLISKKEGIVSQFESSNYKYRKFEYKKWMYEKINGGPDRRFKDNREINYYSFKMLCLNDNCIEVIDHNIYNQLKSEFKMKYHYINDENIFEKKKIEAMKVKHKVFDLISFEKFLIENDLVFNNFGEMIELKYNNKTYLIDINGKVVNSDISIESILGEIN